jgi:hypothetical protein
LVSRSRYRQLRSNALLSELADSLIGFVNTHLIFDQASGWYRVWEWQTAGDALATSPWLGIAYEWTSFAEKVGILQSIDSLWLATALTHGIPGAILLGLSIVSVTFSAVSGPNVNLTAIETRIGITLGIMTLLIIYLSFTVDFWASAWIFISLLVGLRAHIGALGARRLSPHPNKRGRIQWTHDRGLRMPVSEAEELQFVPAVADSERLLIRSAKHRNKPSWPGTV